MYDYYDYGSSGGSTMSTVLSLLMCAVSIVSMWKIFVKAGEPGWAAIIPFYNAYVLFKITWGSGIKFFLMLIPVANIVFAIMTCSKLSKAFGKGGGFTVGLVLLSIVFMPILAFGDAAYLGVGGAAAAGGYTAASAGYASTGESYRPRDERQTYQPQSNRAYRQAATETPGKDTWRCTCGVQCTGAFCHCCGAPKPAAEQAPRSAFCPGCGKKVEPGSAFCPDCGTKLQ